MWAQFLTFDGPPTCGGEAMRRNEVCVDFSGRRDTVDYETMLQAQKESIGISALWRAGIPGMLGTVALVLAVWRRISSDQTTTVRNAFLNALAFVTVPLLVVAVALQLLGARLGWTWASPVGIHGLSQGVLTAIVAVAITLYVPFAWSDERPTAEAPAQPFRQRMAEYERACALARADEVEHQQAKAEAQREKAEQREARATEREAKREASRRSQQNLCDPTSDLWIDRRTQIRPEPASNAQVLLHRIIGLAGLAAMLAALTSDGWWTCGLGIGGLVLVSVRPASRPPTVNTAMLWGAAAALGFGVAMTQLLPLQPVSWTSLLTAAVLGYGSYYKMLSVSYAAETPRLSHIWWHLSSVLLVPTAVLLVLSATISSTAEAVVAQVAAAGALLLAFPFRENFPPQWRAFRRALLGLFFMAGVVIAALGATPTAWIFGGVLGLGTVVSAVLRPETKAAVPVG
ncbi:hypothetical protein UK23_21455 [Lentzea aerocolonigenes]|uniref:Uncharacterized protein n=1 Tax=Lentzea aerocolonigenes TaxID=68170 RepID=A0A0F0GYJ9_LENAE|nr:hypothetical protein UK23_21455 [Lentzea aerocolonigenes]